MTRHVSTRRRGLLILAPRKPDRFEAAAQIARERGWKLVKRSTLDLKTLLSDDADVILLDTIGELAGLYSLADAVFVGGSLVASGGHNILSQLGRAIECHALARDAHMLDHHHRIRALWHSRARHDLHALACAYRFIESAARFDLSDALQHGARMRGVGGAYRETVTRGSVKRRIVTVSNNGLGKYAAASGWRLMAQPRMGIRIGNKVDDLARRRMIMRGSHLDHFFSGVRE